ncbi:M48 family metalloprotease [Parvularcula sp. IMCC14364]|uniref:M48 family metalloprotease n=1 Tax=Parvularcula sp. IMCC14364 TaxID=3067902 RepID=UPI0027417528|nr:M48 family metalloprotease [Parvularcula sp. IMCC14364]
MSVRKRIFCACLWLCLSACISAEHELPLPESETVEATRQEMQREAVAFQLKRRARLYDLSWPLLEANAALCPATRLSIGVVLADLDTYATIIGGLTADQLSAQGLSDDIHLLHVISQSPAAQAGIQRGDFIRAVNGAPVEQNRPGKLASMIRKAAADKEPVRLLVENAQGEREVGVTAVEVCDVAVKLSTSSAINALAQDKTMIVNAGLMRSADDAMVQYIMAHELAHLALRHARKGTWNTIASGAVVYAPLLYAGGAVVDRTRKLFGQKPKRSLARQGLAAAVPFSQVFESEADYVGLYMLVRAGGDINRASDIFRLFAREAPASTWIRYTHPLTPERVAAVELALQEIKVKQAAGEALLPEKVR